MDYAVVGRYGSDISGTLERVNYLALPEYKNFGELLDVAVAGDQLWFAQPGAMVYADVNGTKVHQAAMQTRELRDEYRNRSRFELTKSDRKRVLDLYKAAGVELHENSGRNGSRASRKGLDSTIVSPRMIDHIIGMRTKEEKKEALKLLSGEVVWKAPRPVFFLINMFDDGQAMIPGTGSGRVTAYDPIEDEVYKKNYTSSPDKHPLGDSWHTNPKLKISSGNLTQFIANQENIANATSPQYGFDTIMRIVTRYWLLDHIDALRKVEGTGHGALLTNVTVFKMEDALSALRIGLDKVAFPTKVRARNGTDDYGSGVDHPYENILDFADRFEDTFRGRAIQWKDEGEENATNNMAMFYDGLVKAAEVLEKDPEADVELWQK